MEAPQMQSSQLQDILQMAAAEGKKESSGHFTLDPERSGKKLEAFQLGAPAAYLLRWIQAAGVNPRYVQFYFSRGRLLMIATLNQPCPFELRDLWERLESQQLGSLPADDLVAGLRGSAQRNPTLVNVFLFDSSELLVGQRGRWTAHEIKATGEQKSWLGEDHGWAIELQWKNWFWARPALTQEHATLYQHCRFTPYPIELDSRPLNDPGFYCDRRLQAVHCQMIEQGGIPIPPPGSVDPPQIDKAVRMVGWGVHQWRYQGAQVAHPVAFRGRPSVRARWAAFVPETADIWKYDGGVDIVHRGVTLAPVQSPLLAKGTSVVMFGDELSTDLTGLRVVQDDAYAARLQEVVAALA